MNLMSTHSLGNQSSGFGFVTSLSGKPKTHRKMNREDPLPTWGKRTPFFKSPKNPLQT
ncbi:hypothetical protein H5410_004151 [Solanum commersonii]|uniref:Uncharacterized protein n=1 Tax=Solanum commersonii TaxID=4109 RepID=A0A9J6B752_SOLCO|nr:hypothetical protein H5410_004151 [Solanum commersonii]